MDKDEVGRSAVTEDPDLGLAEKLAAAPRGCRQGLPWLEPGRDERLDLPGELVRPQRAAAEVGSRSDPDAGTVGQCDRLDSPFAPRRDRGLTVRCREAF